VFNPEPASRQDPERRTTIQKPRSPGQPPTIIRTSLMISTSPLDPTSRRVADRLRAGEPVTLYVDELRCPMGVQDLALQLWEIAGLPEGTRQGVWHLCGPEVMSRYALGLLIAAHEHLDANLIIPAQASSSPERRPRDVRLVSDRAGLLSHQPLTVSELFGLSGTVDT
jgi:dTDP-4-dehydrorhamnose reductase